ncbi:hypothetical protein [Bradyrhizobium sp. 1200_D9_N1_1]|uniref:hypothetical protein n=1 Tax=Bradyrhizobium sp. 1200_D9_N1_1 TaxID=3239013 RepID=UPI003F88B1B4
MALKQPILLFLTLVLTFLNLALPIINFTAGAKAEVAGMDWFELAKDGDFRQAVGYVVSKCTIDMDQPPAVSPKILCGR